MAALEDKELAQEWVKNNTDESPNSFRGEELQEAFLAGLEAGRPKWHKVADGDLPKEQKEYWCKVFYYESEETFNAFLWFDVKTKNFKFLEDIEDGIEDSFDVKSWCELPKE